MVALLRHVCIWDLSPSFFARVSSFCSVLAEPYELLLGTRLRTAPSGGRSALVAARQSAAAGPEAWFRQGPRITLKSWESGAEAATYQRPSPVKVCQHLIKFFTIFVYNTLTFCKRYRYRSVNMRV